METSFTPLPFFFFFNIFSYFVYLVIVICSYKDLRFDLL